ncbi:MAG: hypothetical protein AAB458_02330 [Patescibacteria group bacterium]
MKSIVRNSLLGIGTLLALVWMAVPNTARALEVCSGMAVPIMSMTINGTTYANSAGNRDAVYSIAVSSGSTLPVTFTNSSTGATPYNISRTYPVGHTLTYTTNPGTLSYTTDVLTTDTLFAIGVDRDCVEDPSPEGGGSVTVNVTVTAPPAPTATLTASPNPVTSDTPTTLTWTSTNTTSCTATGGAGFSTGSATGGNDASSDLTTATTFSMSCTGPGGTVNKSVTVNVTAPSALSCSANPSLVNPDQNTVVTASGGSGGTSPYYTWNTGGGGSCATGGTCTTSYSTIGTKVVTVTRNGQSSTCNVEVGGGDLPTGAFTPPFANCTVTGWGDDVDTTAPRPIRIYSDGTLVKSTTAGATGCVGASCTFSSSLAGLVSTGVAHSITGEVQGDTNEWVAFSNNPQSLTCPATDVTCSGPTAAQEDVDSVTFTASGGAAHTWAISPTTGILPSGSSGSASSVTKTFTTTGSRTVTFTRTDTGATGACTINITSGPPPLTFQLGASAPGVAYNGTSILVNYGVVPTLSWTSSGADTTRSKGASPNDTLWGVAVIADSGTQNVSAATVRRNYFGDAIRNGPPVQGVNDNVLVRVRPECLPAGQPPVGVNQPVTLTARGGNSTYAWSAIGGTPASGSGASFTVSYSATGTKTVNVGSDALVSSNCYVTVEEEEPACSAGTVVVSSNVPTTWSLSGPSGTITENINQSSETYTDQLAGNYTLSNVPTLEGYLPPSIAPASSQALDCGGTISYTITYTAEPPPPPPGGPEVDLKINGSDNPTPVGTDSVVELTWESNEITSGTCVASEGIPPWSGSRDDSGKGEDSGVLSSDTTFTITCEAGDKSGDVSDSVTILVNAPQCNDGTDNDADTFVDWDGVNGIDGDNDDDPHCDDALDDNEQGDDDTGGDVTECSDGFDNDGDGGIDYAPGAGGDIHCTSVLDDSEKGSPDIREI